MYWQQNYNCVIHIELYGETQIEKCYWYKILYCHRQCLVNTTVELNTSVIAYWIGCEIDTTRRAIAITTVQSYIQCYWQRNGLTLT